MSRLLVIAVGGVLGSLARAAFGLVAAWDPGAWPWATLSVNVIGSLGIGFIAASASLRRSHPLIGPFLITGVLGGFTTFSAFALETGLLLESGHLLTAAAYVLATLVVGLLAVRVGVAVAATVARSDP